MSEKKIRKPVRAILSIIAGVASAAAVFFMLLFFFFAAGLFGWSDGGDKEFLRRLEITTNITLTVAVIAALAVGVVVILRINKIKK